MKIFSFNKFFWTSRMQFWESWRKNSPKVKHFLSSSAKNFVKIRVLPQRNYLLQNVSLDTQNAGLTTPTIKIRWQCEKLLLKRPKIKISPKKLFPPELCSGYVACSFTTLQEAFRSKSENQKKEIMFSSKQLFFLDLFFWTCRMQFWRPCRKTSAQTPKEN